MPTRSTTSNPGGHNDGPHNNGSIEVASTTGSSGTFADEAGTPMVESIDTPTASAAAIVSMIVTTSTTDGPGHDDRDRYIHLASTAGPQCTFAMDFPGTLPVDVTCSMTGLTATATTLALQATINTASDGQRVSNVNNTGNESGGTMVPPEFASGDIGNAGEMRQLTAASGYHDAILALTILSTNFAASDNAGNDDVGIVVTPELVPLESADDGAGTTKSTQHFATAGVDAGTLDSITSTSFPIHVTMRGKAPTDACPPPAILTDWRFYTIPKGLDGTFMVNLCSGERLWQPPASVMNCDCNIDPIPNPEGTWYCVPGSRQWVQQHHFTSWIHLPTGYH